MIPTSVLAFVLIAQGPANVLEPFPVILVSHEAPTEGEKAAMLAASTEASKRGQFRIWDSGDARFVFSKNLFNLDSVEKRIQGTSALREAVATSDSVTFLASITSEERASIQEFFTDATFFPELGASILAPDATFMVEKLGRVELSDGVKSVEIDLPRARGESPPKGFLAKPPTTDQRSRQADAVARRRVKPYKDILTFLVLQKDMASSKRARAISAFSEWLANDLERQTRAYQSARAALLAKAFPPAPFRTSGRTRRCSTPRPNACFGQWRATSPGMALVRRASS